VSVAPDVVVQEELDAAVRDLVANKRRWASTGVEERDALLDEIKDRLADVADGWAETASRRNLLHGGITLLPRPPWFVTNKKADILGKLLTRFQYRPSLLKIPRIFMNALLG